MTLTLGNSQTDLPSSNEVVELPDFELDPNPDQLGQLSQFGWQVGNLGWLFFPVTNVQTHISQELAVHKYPDLDAARVENTGRNPIEVTATAIFVNTITPGPKESWIAGTLYPNVYQQVLTSALKRETGILQHPFIGQFAAKLVSASTVMNAAFRGGEIMELRWIETINSSDILSNIQSTSPQVVAAATTLDSQLAAVTPAQLAALQTNGYIPSSFVSAMLEVASIVGQGQLQALKALGAINNVIHLCTSLIQAIVLTNDIQLSTIKNAAWIFYAQALDYSNLVNTVAGKTIKTYVTQKAMTLNTIGSVLGVSLSDLIKLNPQLVASPVVPAYTKVRFYG